MNVTLKVTDRALNELTKSVTLQVKAAQTKAELKMAETFQGCVLANFGATGLYRPWSGWAPLSPAYAKKVGRTYATLEVSGRLKANVLLELNDRGNFSVTSDNDRVPYAMVHQTGGDRMPQREYFPMNDDGVVTRQVTDLCVEAARAELERILN